MKLNRPVNVEINLLFIGLYFAKKEYIVLQLQLHNVAT